LGAVSLDMLRWILPACFAAIAFAQGTEPKPKAADYDVTGVSKNIAIGAEFMVHSFGGNGQMFIAQDFLVVELALFPPKGESVTVDYGAFALRINGKKPALLPQPATMVAATLTRPEWRMGRQAEASAGMGNADIILGRPVPSQIPGGPSRRPPAPPRAPAPGPPGGIDRPEPVRAEELVVQTALPSGEHRGPVSGFLYFAWKGKPSSIKSLELLYQDTILKLR
jgi:hypothetical protein